MKIHVVQQGDTVASIAKQYEVSVERLIMDNGLQDPLTLVNGQTLVIVFPVKTYTVQEGDTLLEIANKNGITMNQLLRNNPYLSNREYIYPGETLVISYDNNRGKITANGYANTFIKKDTLRKTLPFLTYLSIFGYRTLEEGDIVGIDDRAIIELAKEYQVAPIMMLTTRSEKGGSNPSAVNLLYNEEHVDKNIDNILSILDRKGYYGINITFQFISEDNLELYENYTKKLSERIKQEGYLLFITISENFIIEADKVTFEKINFSNIAQMVDGITILNYNWGYSFGPPGPVVSVYLIKQFLNYLITMIPPEKIEIGIPILGYDWELPYIIGFTKANSLTQDSAVVLAGETQSDILFDEVSKNPYFDYVDTKSGSPRKHEVWFVDARTIDEILNMISEYGFRGTGIWNIMYYYAQMWAIMSSEYEIETLFS